MNSQSDRPAKCFHVSTPSQETGTFPGSPGNHQGNLPETSSLKALAQAVLLGNSQGNTTETYVENKETFGVRKATKVSLKVTTPDLARAWPSVILRNSKLGKPIVFAFDEEAASALEVRELGYPVFTRQELANLAGASINQWKDAVVMKRGAPDWRTGGYEVIKG